MRGEARLSAHEGDRREPMHVILRRYQFPVR